jgi:hypothetical protein
MCFKQPKTRSDFCTLSFPFLLTNELMGKYGASKCPLMILDAQLTKDWWRKWNRISHSDWQGVIIAPSSSGKD